MNRYPLTFAEQQMIIEQSLNPETVSYNINLNFAITGIFSVERLAQALQDLNQQHCALRSYYPMVQGEYVHCIADDLPIPVGHTTCAAAEVAQFVKQANVPFDLSVAPLYRCHVYQHDDTHCTLNFCFHHTIIDGGSTPALFGDLFALYRGETLEPLTYTYLDHALAQQSLNLTAQKAAFEAIFADGVPENDMPTVVTRPSKLPVADQTLTHILQPALLKEKAAALGVTTFQLLFSVFGMVLAKYCGTEDVVMGTAMSGRTTAEVKNLVGMFVNTLPVRIKPQADLTVRDYLQQSKDAIRHVMAQQDYPLEKLVPQFAPDANPSRMPIFDVLVNYLHTLRMPAMDDFTAVELPTKHQDIDMDLVVEFLHYGDELRCTVSYSAALYQPAVVENMMEQFVYTLEQVLAGTGEQTVAQVTDLPARQSAQILTQFQGAVDDTNLGETIVSLFAKQVARTPQNQAVVYQAETLTYAQLDALTDNLACHLQQLGVGKGAVVGVMVGRGVMMPLAALAVLKAGAAYLPMDPTYPTERLLFMLEDTAAQVVIIDTALQSVLADYHGTFVLSEAVAALPSATQLPTPPQTQDPMILLYTSGTTGKPKGVVLLHRNLVSFVHHYQTCNGIGDTDRIAAYASFGFDANMMDTYPTLLAGACLHIIPEDMRLDLLGMAQYFNDNAITVAFMTTQLGRQFADTMHVPTLRVMSTGGEALSPIKPPSFPFCNLYGPTECTVFSNRFVLDGMYDRIPIGKTVENTHVYVVDAHGRLAPVGVAGELCIAGRQVAWGYLNRPDLTDEKFVPNPFCDAPDYNRMYKTGDVVRYLASGDVDFVGRRDFQVKIRGFRVELTEIEGRIRDFAGIKDATVQAQEDAGGGKRIVSYIVADETVDIAALHTFIGDELPPYMVPSATLQIDAIPLTPNGKVNRRALPKLTIQVDEILPPASPLEQQIFDVVAQVLGTEEFGVTTDLMYAGLNSLSSIKAATLVAEAVGKKVIARDIMREKTVRNLAVLLQDTDAYTQKTYAKQESYPLTQNQLGVYFACMMDPQSLVYNIPLMLEFSPALDAEKLRESVLSTVEAHPYVKTHFRMEHNQPMQCRLDDAPVAVDITHCTQAEFMQAKAAFVRPFHFFDGNLFRIALYCTPEHVYLLCDFHHIIFDGGSFDIFCRDLTAAYDGATLTPETFTSFEVALAEQELRNSPAYAQAQAFYQARLGDGEGATQIPSDAKKDAPASAQIALATLPLPAVFAAVKALGVTPANLFLAATLLVTGKFASTKAVRIATIHNGRDDAQCQRNLGMLVKTLPVAYDLSTAPAAQDLLFGVQQEMLDSLAHTCYSYLEISSAFQYNTQILYAFQGGVVSNFTVEGTTVPYTALQMNQGKFPISINIYDTDDQYTVQVEYDTANFGQAFMQTFADCIAHAASLLAQQPTKQLAQVSIVTPAQAAHMQTWRKPLTANTANALFTLFEQQAQATPDALALFTSNKQLTFAELNESANRMAHSLLAMQVQVEDRIAFMLPRDHRILVAMLGIMKAGCAYIPVDPDYPDERIAHVLSDSGAQYILTDGSRDVAHSLPIDQLCMHENSHNPQVAVSPENLCYIIYTSGSTGKPKGVMLSHGNIINYVVNTPENRHVQALVDTQCRMVSVTTVSFDMFLKEAFTTLMNGLPLILANDEQAKNPKQLAALFTQAQGTGFNATPSRMLQYMELPEIRQALTQCKVIMAGGEGYPAVLYQKLRALTDAVLINTYGPTEITVSSNGKILDCPDVTIGAPLHNVYESVMDTDGNPLPVGVTGELWIAGTGVARGYYGNPQMTDERFVMHDGMRYYKSGDLARFTNEGEVVILGRNDGQIKLRGLRIELGEIEKTLGEIEAVSSCAVFVRKLHGQEHLCAYYTANCELSAKDLREQLGKSLTKYMVPTAYLQLDTMPMTPNGKIDRKALPDACLMQAEEYIAPANDAEQAYCDIFAKVLQLDRVGATDNFFDLGGTSLLVTQVTIEAATHDYELSFSEVFANPTPQALALLGSDAKPTAPAQDDAITSYDYSKIHALLANNNLNAFRTGTLCTLGNVCITGATGFLGIHILREFLTTQKGIAYCVVRGGRVSAEKRLKSMLMYYFSDSYETLFGARIFVVDGSITDDALYPKLMDLPIDTYLNCAANVKHFSAGTDIADVNLGGVQKAVAFALRKGCRMVQVSTGSIAGMSIDGTPDEAYRMDETQLYFGQDLSNQYANSKFLAERHILEAVVEHGLDAKIMRVGNLMARKEDGEFQANFATNNFLGRLRAYYIIGHIPYSHLVGNAEFSPIDCTARAILRLSCTPKDCHVFHPYNSHTVFFGDAIACLAQTGLTVTPCELDVYEAAYAQAMRNPDKAKKLNSLIAYQQHGKRVVPLKTNNGYTAQTLLRLGFHWPITDEAYLMRFIQAVRELGFFDEVE